MGEGGLRLLFLQPASVWTHHHLLHADAFCHRVYQWDSAEGNFLGGVLYGEQCYGLAGGEVEE